MKSALITNIGELVTLDPLVKSSRFTLITDTDLGRIKDSWLYLENGKVHSFGSGLAPKKNVPVIDAKKGLVIPGLIDCHTHPVFAGNRSNEFSRRLSGATYTQIASEGGGIKRTVKETRLAKEDELLKSCNAQLAKFLENGVTTLEAKSGYGLDIETELRLLSVLNSAKSHTKQHMEVTLLALHALPENASSKEAFLKDMNEKLLPEVSRRKLATFVDAFVEEGYFSIEEARAHFDLAKSHGFGIRVHADEFTDLGGGALAAEVEAASADHLEYTSDPSIKKMAEAGVVAVLLPGTSLYTKIAYTQAKGFLKHNCPIAIATDYNPGSCRLENLAFMASLGGLHCGLDLPHTIAAVTWVAARSLRLEKYKGALSAGMDGDALIYDYRCLEDWVAGFGQLKPHKVFIKGESVLAK